MPFSAYDSFKALDDNLYDILANIGQKYTINFSWKMLKDFCSITYIISCDCSLQYGAIVETVEGNRK